MHSNDKMRNLNKRITISLKHLRGRHDQRDHAWNRGMGKGGGYMPAALSPQQFQNMRADFQARVGRGEITQEVADATMKRVREIYNQEYDANIENTLSRRNQTIESFANRRLSNSPSVDLSAAAIRMNTVATSLANQQNYNGRSFPSRFQSIASIPASQMSQEDRNNIDQTYESPIGTRPIMASEAGIYAVDKVQNALQILRQQIIVERQGRLTELKKEMIEAGKTSIDSADYDAQRFLEYISMDIASFKDNNSISRSARIEDFAKKIEEYIERYENLNVSTDKAKKEQETSLTALRQTLNALHPTTFLALYDYAKAKTPSNIYKTLLENQMIDSVMILPRNAIRDYETVLTGDLQDDVKTLLSIGMLQGGFFTTDTLETYQPNPDFLFEILSFISTNKELKNKIASIHQLPLDRDITIEDFRKEIFRSSTDSMSQYIKSYDSLLKLRKLGAQQIVRELTEKVPLLANTYEPTPEEKNIIRNAYMDYLDATNKLINEAKIKYLNPQEALQYLNPMVNTFTDPIWIRSIPDDEAYKLIEESCKKYGNENLLPPIKQFLDDNKDYRFERSRTENELLAIRISELQDTLRNARQDNEEEKVINNLEMQIDDAQWEIVQNNLLAQNPNLSIEENLRERIRQGNFTSEYTRNEIEKRYKSEKAQRVMRVQNKFDEIVKYTRRVDMNSIIDKKLSEWFVESVKFQKIDGYSDAEIFSNISDNMYHLHSFSPDIKFEKCQEFVRNLFQKHVDLSQNPNNVTNEMRAALWGENAPTLISTTSDIQPGQSRFESPAFAFGNPLYLDTPETVLPPDNPDQVPLFNPKYARFAARDIIDTKNGSIEPILDDSQSDNIRNALEKYGYADDMINNVLGLINDRLIPFKRSKRIIENVDQWEETNSYDIVISYGTHNDGMRGSGKVKIKLHRNPNESSVENYVHFMEIPEELYDGADNPYKGASGPLLMYAGDQLRRLGYELKTSNVRYSADAVNVNDKTVGQSSGPTTWPTLGATCFVQNNPRVLHTLYRMGYSDEFIEYVKKSPNAIPSYLFFLNAPPSFYSITDKGKLLKRKSTQQGIWSELYDSGATDSSFGVTLNLATPNDPSRLINQMLPGSKK